MPNDNLKLKSNTGFGQKFQAAPEQPAGKRRRKRDVSEYKKSLQEKQALKNLYGLSEKQVKRYVKETLGMLKAKNLTDELIKVLERRLDNVVFRLGFAKSIPQSRQIVSHAYFLVNGKPVNIPSFKVNIGDTIAIKESKKKKIIFKDLPATLKKVQVSPWLSLDKEKFEGKIMRYPTLAEVNPPVEISLIFEFYSR